MSYFPSKTTERGFGDGIGAGIGVRAGLGQRSGSCTALSCFISLIFEVSILHLQCFLPLQNPLGWGRRSVRMGLQGSGMLSPPPPAPLPPTEGPVGPHSGDSQGPHRAQPRSGDPQCHSSAPLGRW